MTQMMPPEWAPQRWLWIGFPHLADEWNGFLAAAQGEIAAFARAVAESGQEARLVVPDAVHEALARELAGEAVTICIHPYGDVWLRDTGPLVVRGAEGKAFAQRFGFNGWGGKYVMPGDTEIGGLLAEEAGLDSDSADWVLEGGAIDVDGNGLGVTTEQCLLNPNRNGHLGKAEVEKQLSEYLGLEHVIWLPRGFCFDETDGHVDDVCCFVRPGVVAMSWTDDRDDPQYEIVREVEDVLRSARDARGRALEVHRILHPRPIEMTAEEAAGVDQVDSTWARPAGNRIAATYINYYPGNSSVVVPQFDDDTLDRAAKAKLAELFPEHRIVGIENSREILLGGGNVACITLPVYAGQTKA